MRALSLAWAALAAGCAASPQPSPTTGEPPSAASAQPAAPTASAPAASAPAASAPAASASARSLPAPRKTCPPGSVSKASSDAPWALLAQKGACVELISHTQGPANRDDTVLVETVESRKLGQADVVRLRFTRTLEGASGDATPSELMSTLIAISKAGVHLLDPKADDKAIEAALKKPPSLALGAKDGSPSARNGYTFALKARTERGPAACLVKEVPRSLNTCEDTCTGMVCLSPEGGVVILEGVAAPFFGTFIRDGYNIAQEKKK